MILKWRQIWHEQIADDKKTRARMILDGSNILFFFTYKGDLYGSGESARVTYAKMRDPDDEDHTPGWLKDASFSASNLFKCVDGETENQTIFSQKDMKDIDVITDKNKVEKLLMKHAENDRVSK